MRSAVQRGLILLTAPFRAVRQTARAGSERTAMNPAIQYNRDLSAELACLIASQHRLGSGTAANRLAPRHMEELLDGAQADPPSARRARRAHIPASPRPSR
jgi:hypothetical protein